METSTAAEAITPSETITETTTSEPIITPITQNTQIAPIVVVSPTNSDKMNKEIEELFQVVIGKIRLSVANQQITIDSFTSILLKVVETIEDVSQLNSLSGIEKRSIAINLTKMVIDDLHKHGQISDDIYNALSIGVDFLAPLIFTAAKDAWKKIQEVQDDIELNGCKGCFGRNCSNSKVVNKSRSRR